MRFRKYLSNAPMQALWRCLGVQPQKTKILGPAAHVSKFQSEPFYFNEMILKHG